MSMTRWQRASACLLAGLGAVSALAAHAALPTVPSPVAEAAPAAVGAGGGLLQAGVGMALVLGLIFLCAWLARRFGLQRFGGGQLVKVVSSAAVGQRERVVVVEVGATWLVLGVTPSQVNMLHTLPAQALPGVVAGVMAGAGAPAAGAAALPRTLDLFAQKLRESITGRSRPAP